MSEREGRDWIVRGAAAISLATAASRVTGFVRVVVVAAAMGTTFLANTYQTANTAPNLLFELVAAGVLTSVFVPTFVDYLVKEEREAGWRAANALFSVALVGLIALSLLLAWAAPALMRLLTLGVEDASLRAQEIDLGTRFLRLFAPQVVFYGAGMIITGALHAHRRFALPAIAPIANNLVVICVYLAYAAMRGDRPPEVGGITSGEVLVLGLGTTMGVVAMTICLLPGLRTIGWRMRFDLSPSHPAVARATRLGVWALGYAGGYQAGLIVVLLLANGVEGGVAAYQWAYTFFYLPHALFGAPIFHVLFPAMAEHAARGESTELLARLREGLSALAFILVPIAAVLVVEAEPIARATLEFGVMTTEGADLVARVMAAFALGLPTYSAFLVLTRAYYALQDARTPTLVNAGTIAVASGTGAFFFTTLPEPWAVAGLALGHSLAFGGGALVLGRALSRRVGAVGGPMLSAAVTRAVAFTGLALPAMLVARWVIPEDGRTAAIANFLIVAAIGAAVYVFAMVRAKAPELARLRGALRPARP